MRKWLAMFPALFVSALSVAQTAPAKPAAPPLGGPTIDGVCLLSREAIYANAKVGKAATARLQVLTREAQSEVDAERAKLDTDVKAFQAQQATLPAEDRAKRQKDLEARLQAMQAQAAQRSREIEATRVKVLDRIATEAQPVMAQVYQQRKCGLLIDRNAVLGGNMTNDLTTLVVQALDGKITTITFDRESLPAATASTMQ